MCWDLLNALADRKCHPGQQQQQLNHPNDSATSVALVPYTIVVPLVHLWQQEMKAAGSLDPDRGLISPAALSSALTRYQQAGILSPSSAPHTSPPSRFPEPLTTAEILPTRSSTQYISAMILDVAAHLATRSSSNGGLGQGRSSSRRRTNDEDARSAGSNFCQEYLQEWIQDSSREPPDVVAVGTVLQAIVATTNQPQHAEDFWDRITHQLPHLQPNEFWYNSMISAWARQGNIPMAMKWLNRMRKVGQDPDLATWNALLAVHAKHHDGTAEATTTTTSPHNGNVSAAEQAESILYQMKELYEQGHLKDPPNVISYSTVLDAWAQRAWNNPQAAQRAQQLLQRMEEQSSHNGNGVVPAPNIISYNTVIQAHGRAGNPERAEQVFLGLLENDQVRPNEITITAVLSAWSHVGTWEAAERAERILKEIIPQMGLRPDIFAYSACLACWAKIPNQKHAMERAQALFDELLVSPSPHLRPDVVAYTNLMNVYGRYDEPEKVESLLEDMLRLDSVPQSPYKDDRLRPNVHTFSVIISAWVRSSRRDGVERAERWLHRMQDEFGIRPNVVSYSTVLHAWSKRARQDPEAPDRAHNILRKISKMANSRSFAAVIQAYAQQGRAAEAETLLQQMLVDTKDTPQPDSYAFSAVLHAWSKTTDFPPTEAAQRAEKLLMLMHELYNEKKLREPPNVVCFSNVLKCWSRIPGIEGVERAHAILETMTSYGARPNIFSINIVMNAWANHAGSSPHAMDKVSSLFEFATKNHQPDAFTYRAMLKAITLSSLPDKADLAARIMDEMSQKGIQSENPYQKQRASDVRGEERDVS
jgi:pentatricopeptide repeat protein